ncbi:hypothetical protein [Saccharothrix hoggarensis]|uniref:Secreted protein n=1 Tax=Saccharothrix hoggarensis TaxID=913853 RepID=A0ABW3QPV4_9PSEU
MLSTLPALCLFLVRGSDVVDFARHFGESRSAGASASSGCEKPAAHRAELATNLVVRGSTAPAPRS